MLNRRLILKSGVAAAALTAIDTPFSLAWADAGADLNKLFDTFMTENLDDSPLGATQLGIDVGPRAHQRGEIDDNSMAGIAKAKALNASQAQRLAAFDAKPLTGMDAVNYEVVLYGLQTQDKANKSFDYGGQGAGAPYVISQLTGLYLQFPDFLDSVQPVETKEDAEAYISRIDKIDVALDNDVAVARHDVAEGVVPPDFALTKTLSQLTTLRAIPVEKSTMVASLVRRTKEKSIPGDWEARATKITSEKIYPALDRHIAFVKEMQAKATHDAGVWKLPNGIDYYAQSVTFWTTSTMSPEEIHKTGLEVVADYTARIDADMKKLGLTKGTVGERLRSMYNDKKFIYPNTDEGKEKLLADLNTKIQVIRKRLPEYFGVLPKADLLIKRVPKEAEAGSAGGYYNPPSLDGKRPGMYYINLRDTAEQPSFALSTLSYHEGIPGHHLQGSIANESPLPMIRKISFFSAYIEGWALYAEQFADEMGMYADDPWGRIGYMHDAMFRGVRLVVDSGMHAMKWSREQAVKYFVDTLGDQDASSITEVERYCVWPGQACGYMLGKLAILRNRERAKQALGAKFDIRDFHDAVLMSGAVPLSVLDKVVDRYIAAKKA